MTHLSIKGLSLNHAYRGRRFITPELKQFKRDMMLILPKMSIPVGKLQVVYRFGVSSKNSDADNLVKTCQDSLAECYGFNDKKIYHITVEKEDVVKGEEFIEFEIKSYPQGEACDKI